MNAMARETQRSKEFGELKFRPKTTWMTVEAEYLEVIGTRGRSMPAVPQTTATHKTGGLHGSSR